MCELSFFFTVMLLYCNIVILLYCYLPRYRNCVITSDIIRYYIYYETLYLHKEAWNLDESYGLGKKLNKQIKNILA